MEVGQFEDIEDFVQLLRLLDDQGGVPIQDGQVVFIVAEVAAGGFVGLLPGELVDVGFLGEEGGHFAAMLAEPVFRAQGLSVVGDERSIKTKDGIGFLFRQLSDGPEK